MKNGSIENFVKSIEWIRESLLPMDSLADPVMGIGDWDDACCVGFGNERLIVSADGPYTKRLVMKSALIHASTDIVVKGGVPLFALDTLIGRVEDIKEMITSLKKQSLKMKIPILGGNTLYEDVEPRCSLTIVGNLLIKEPVRDSGAMKGDILLLLGRPIWGGQDERISRAKTLFSVWYEILKNEIEIHASKDVTKGGLVSCLYEMSKKSQVEYNLCENIPYPMTRNLDNFLISVPDTELDDIKRISNKYRCPIVQIGYFQ